MYFIFKPFVPALAGESGHDNRYGSLRIPCRILKSAGLIRSWEFCPTPHGRQTIAGVRIAATDRGEVAGAFNGVLCRSKVCVSEFGKPGNIDVDTSNARLVGEGTKDDDEIELRRRSKKQLAELKKLKHESKNGKSPIVGGRMDHEPLRRK